MSGSRLFVWGDIMGDYIQRSDIEAKFGANNVSVWADMDDDADATKIANRITAAIVFAERMSEDRLRDRFAVPITSPSGNLERLKEICVRKAGGWLYFNRGQTDEVERDDMMEAHRERAESMIDNVLAGIVRVDWVTAGGTAQPSGPMVAW